MSQCAAGTMLVAEEVSLGGEIPSVARSGQKTAESEEIMAGSEEAPAGSEDSGGEIWKESEAE